MGVRDAVGARVTAADDDDVLARGADPAGRGPGDHTSTVVEVLHGEVHTAQVSARHGKVAWHAGACRQDDRVVLRAQLGGGDVDPDVDAEPEVDTFGDELLATALDQALLDLELGHAEADEPARRLVPFVDDHVLARARELLRACEARRARTDDGDAAAGRGERRQGHDPAFVPGAIDDRELDLLDRDGVALVDLEDAGCLTRRRAQPAGELGEVVRAVELLDRLLPAVAVDEVVPVGDQVSERTAVVAERNATFHAARRLFTQLGQRERSDELAEVADPLARGTFGCLEAAHLQERAEPPHQAASSLSLVKKPAPPVETG